jgi:hypothetical protein
MKAESDFQTYLPKPHLTLWVTATGLKIWLKSWTLLLIGCLLKGIQGAYRLYVLGDWTFVSVSRAAFNAPKNAPEPEHLAASDTASGILASRMAFISGLREPNGLNFNRVALTLAGTNIYIPLKPNYYEKSSFIDGRPDDSGCIECKCKTAAYSGCQVT